GIELQLRGHPVRTQDVTWDITWNIATNANTVLSLGQPAGDCATDSLAQVNKDCRIVLGSQQHRVGYPAASFFREKVVSAQLDSDGHAIQSTVMCDGGPALHHQPVRCYDDAGTVIAPRVFLGRSTSSSTGSSTTRATPNSVSSRSATSSPTRGPRASARDAPPSPSPGATCTRGRTGRGWTPRRCSWGRASGNTRCSSKTNCPSSRSSSRPST